MRKRLIRLHEQPHVLQQGLQSAQVIREMPADPSTPVEPTSDHGVPHGVEGALVYLDGLEIRTSNGVRSIYFCRTHSYVAVGSTFQGADDGEYPSLENATISASAQLPPDGTYAALARVGVNGSLAIHLQRIGVKMPKVSQLETASA